MRNHGAGWPPRVMNPCVAATTGTWSEMRAEAVGTGMGRQAGAGAGTERGGCRTVQVYMKAGEGAEAGDTWRGTGSWAVGVARPCPQVAPMVGGGATPPARTRGGGGGAGALLPPGG